MAKTATVRAMMDPQKKERVDNILKRLGMTHSEAINIFYSMIEENRGLPFEVKLGNGNGMNKSQTQTFIEAGRASIEKNRKLLDLLAK